MPEPIIIEFYVPGRARPAGSKTRTRWGFRDASGTPGKEWRARIAFFARKEIDARGLKGRFPIPVDQPLKLCAVFNIKRPKKHYRSSGALRSDAPYYPTSAPDSTKLMRALEDALNGVIWTDDRQIPAPYPLRVYAKTPGVHVIVTRMPRPQPGPVTLDLFEHPGESP